MELLDEELDEEIIPDEGELEGLGARGWRNEDPEPRVGGRGSGRRPKKKL